MRTQNKHAQPDSLQATQLGHSYDPLLLPLKQPMNTLTRFNLEATPFTYSK